MWDILSTVIFLCIALPIALFVMALLGLADGKKKGRKGLSKRVGVSQKMSIAKLAKIAKTASGERKRMAQWNLNMKRGRKRKKK